MGWKKQSPKTPLFAIVGKGSLGDNLFIMAFSSILFLIYLFPVIFIGYYVLPPKLRKYWLLCFSMFLYFWGSPKFFFILILSVFLDYYLSFQLVSERNLRELFLWILILANLSLLIFFKYTGFLLSFLNPILTVTHLPTFPMLTILLPLGISFITFQKISYLLDVYQGKEKPAKILSDYVLYIFMFPQMLSGPITRYRELIPQISHPPISSQWENRLAGFFRFVFGLSKKILIGNVLGSEADHIFAVDAKLLSFDQAWYGILCYTLQIYFDFSGYSDMAIGLAKMLDYQLPENFNAPYISQSITEFWRRWHMTLGSFMRDYIYIPLGGNRGSAFMVYRNLWLVFLISGIWHGPSWNFVLWGALHGMFLVLDRLLEKKQIWRVPTMFKILVTFLIVVFSWVLFRTADLSQALAFYQAMFRWEFKNIALVEPYILSIFGIGLLLSFLPYFQKLKNFLDILRVPQKGKVGLGFQLGFILFLFWLTIGEIASTKFSPFIYFRF